MTSPLKMGQCGRITAQYRKVVNTAIFPGKLHGTFSVMRRERLSILKTHVVTYCRRETDPTLASSWDAWWSGRSVAFVVGRGGGTLGLS